MKMNLYFTYVTEMCAVKHLKTLPTSEIGFLNNIHGEDSLFINLCLTVFTTKNCNKIMHLYSNGYLFL